MKLLKCQGSSPTSQVLLPRNITRNSEGWVCKVWNSRGFCGNLIKSPSSFPTHTPPSPIPPFYPLYLQIPVARGDWRIILWRKWYTQTENIQVLMTGNTTKSQIYVYSLKRKRYRLTSPTATTGKMSSMPCSCMNGNPEQNLSLASCPTLHLRSPCVISTNPKCIREYMIPITPYLAQNCCSDLRP